MNRTAGFILLLLVSCSSVTISPAHLRRSDLADHRRRAAKLIASEQMDQHLNVLLESLKSDPSPIVRAQCAVSIGQLGKRNKKVYRTLTRALNTDPDPVVQRDVIFALTELNYEQSIPDLKEKVKSSSHPDVRADAARAIQQLGTQEDTDVLVEGLSDKSYRVRHACYDALQSMTELNGPLDPDWWKNQLNKG